MTDVGLLHCGRTLSLGLHCTNETLCVRFFFLCVQQARRVCNDILLSLLELHGCYPRGDVLRSVDLCPLVLRIFFCDFNAGGAVCTRPTISDGLGCCTDDRCARFGTRSTNSTGTLTKRSRFPRFPKVHTKIVPDRACHAIECQILITKEEKLCLALSRLSRDHVWYFGGPWDCDVLLEKLLPARFDRGSMMRRCGDRQCNIVPVPYFMGYRTKRRR